MREILVSKTHYGWVVPFLLKSGYRGDLPDYDDSCKVVVRAGKEQTIITFKGAVDPHEIEKGLGLDEL